MTAAELRERFTREIEKRAVDDRYIDGLEERELLQIGLQHGFTTDEVRKFLIEVCGERGYVIEAAVVQKIRDALRARSSINRGGFESLVSQTRPSLAGTTRTEHDLRRLVLTTLEDSPTRIRTGWFRNWYERLRREVGA